MKCGPDGCPIIAFSDLTAAEQRIERKRTAIKMTEQGFTEQVIAKQLGVSQQTISSDLASLPVAGKLNPRISKRGRKGEGRPKGTHVKRKSEKLDLAREAVRPHVIAGEGVSRAEWAKRLGVGVNVVQRAVEAEYLRLEIEPEITPDMLAMTAQQKLETAMRQQQRKLDLTFEDRVQNEVNDRLDHLVLPVWRKKIAEAKKIYDARRSITNKETFNIILKCLHTDTRRHVSDAIANEAFTRFLGLEKYLLNEKDSPTPFVGLPTTAAGWEQRKQEAAAMRRAKRGNANIDRERRTI